MKLVFMRRSDQEVPPANRTIKGRGCDAPPKFGNGTSCCMERHQSTEHLAVWREASNQHIMCTMQGKWSRDDLKLL
jgi:hypothetical protein